MWEIRRYTPENKEEWDAFVATSRNSTFLFKRGYMDYHSDRFSDCSLMAYRRGKLAAVLPANMTGDTLHSHQGLTYGGWAWRPSGLDVADIFQLWKAWLRLCREEGVNRIVYKALPYIYSEMPSEEDRYMLFLSGAVLTRCDMSTAIDLRNNPGFNQLQKRHLKGAPPKLEIRRFNASNGEGVEEGIEMFWNMLRRCLEERHEARPVHSVSELSLLMHRFPENISIWSAVLEGEMLGGVCTYQTKTCLHCQYIATTPRGRETNVLAPLFAEMVDCYTQHESCRYLDFGISNENRGRSLNAGLNRQKTSYGGSGVAYKHYEINVASALKSLPTELWPPR